MLLCSTSLSRGEERCVRNNTETSWLVLTGMCNTVPKTETEEAGNNSFSLAESQKCFNFHSQFKITTKYKVNKDSREATR